MPKAKRENIKKVKGLISKKHQSALSRFPLLFTLLATFGLVATLYGFERIIDDIDVFAKSPYILLIVGLLILAFTGSLYKKLSN